MGTGGKVIFRRGRGGKRRRRLDGDEDDEDDEEYVAEEEEEEEEDYEEAGGGEESGSSDEEEEEEEIGGSDSEFEEEEELSGEEDEEFEIQASRPKRPGKPGGRARRGKPAAAARSRRRRHDDDDDYEEEEDEDFDPDGDDEEDFDGEDEEEEEFGTIRPKKVRVRKELVKRKSGPKRRQKKKKKNSRVSKRKRTAKSKSKKATTVRRRRKRSAIDSYDDEDEDFIVKDRIEVNRRPRKKAKVGNKKRARLAVPVLDAEMWPSVDSDSSDFEFVTSDEELAEEEMVPVEPARSKGKKGRRKRISGSESSDSDYVISEEELRDLGVIGPPEVKLLLPSPPTRAFIGRKGEEKGKEKEPAELSRQVCGICLSEEQRATVQGLLNCCSHYFCFGCIMEWSKVESRCPLCKRRFTTITKSSKADLGLGVRKAVIRVEERDQVYQPTEEELRRWLDPYENVVCIECNQGGDDNLMLLCDICDSSAHTYCVGLGREVPEGNWYCGGCRSAGEGPSYAQVQDRMAYGENNSVPIHGTSEAFGTAAPIGMFQRTAAPSGVFQRPAAPCGMSQRPAAPSGMFQRPPAVDVQPSFQEIDLNLSPRDLPDDNQPAESHTSSGGVLTPSGRRATLSGRRLIHQHIRFFLSRPRPEIRPDASHTDIHNGTMPGIQQSQGNSRASTHLSSSQRGANVMQSQQNSLPFVQSHSNFSPCTNRAGNNFQRIEGAKEQVAHMVKSNLKHLFSQFPLENPSAFKSIARRATHTILAACAIEHNRDMVVATTHPPSSCRHVLHGQERALLMRNCCSSCFSSFVSDVVKDVFNMYS